MNSHKNNRLGVGGSGVEREENNMAANCYIQLNTIKIQENPTKCQSFSFSKKNIAAHTLD